ncbi:MAG: AAA family ATPase [Firmicutes bacterium]|nr:AAA family ATPase [Bacillota bacterium]
MDKKLILAVAGSGKTYTICNSIEAEKRNLVLAFTRENIKNIYFELLARFGVIPENTIISTFHAFLYRDCIRPYHSLICDLYGAESFRCEGVTLLTPPKPFEDGEFNRKYIKENNLKHYVPHKKYYCSRMAKLITKNNDTLLPLVLKRLNKFYDKLFVDEFQDYRNEEYELLAEIIQGFEGDVLLVGDYYQHSVSGDNNTGKPFGTANKTITYLRYKKIIEELGVNIDETTLCKSRRCSKLVCDFVRTKLRIEIESYDSHAGEVIAISDIAEAERVLMDDSICKLLLRNSGNFIFRSVNWSYSKGDTYEKTCVILTEDTSNLMEDSFNCDSIAPITRNKLYVALTRSRTDVYLMPKYLFDQVKDKYYR